MMNLFLPKTFKPARWKRTRPQRDAYECILAVDPPDYVLTAQTYQIPLQVNNLIGIANQLRAQRQADGTADTITIYTDLETADQCRKAYARIQYYYLRHMERHQRWLAAGCPRRIAHLLGVGRMLIFSSRYFEQFTPH